MKQHAVPFGMLADLEGMDPSTHWLIGAQSTILGGADGYHQHAFHDPDGAPPVPVVTVEPPRRRRLRSVKVEQLQLDLFAATGNEAPNLERLLDDALTYLANAYLAKGELPTMDDCHRQRYGLPGMSAFNAAGGWHVCIVKFRAEWQLGVA